MNLEQYAARERQKRLEFQRTLESKGGADGWEHIRRQCKEKGYYVIGNWFDKSSVGSVRIGVHGYVDPNDRMGYMHRHNFFELIYVYRGHFVNVFPDQTIRMQQGDLMLLNPNVLHAPYVEEDSDLVFNIFISNDMVREKIIPFQKDNALLISFFMDFLYWNSREKKFLYFTDNSPASIQIAETIIEEYNEQRPLYQNTMDACLALLFSQLSRDYCKNHSIDMLSKSRDTLSYEIISYISQNCSHITLDTLAEHFQYSPNYLSRLIRQSTGKTFIQLVSQHKLQRAAEFLITTDLSIGDIAQVAGFGDVSHFIKSFKKEYSLSPAQYRKNKKASSRPPDASKA